MSKPSLLYVGHSYHQLTNSTKFLMELLERDYRLSVLWDEGWKPGGEPMTAERINRSNPDVVLFFQMVPATKELRQITCRRQFLVPMHDHVVGNPQRIWKQVRASRLRVLNFCRATHAIFTGLGYESLCVQYWQPPQRREVVRSNGIDIFFWVRMKTIGWPLLKALLGSARPRRIVLRTAEDPGQDIDMPSEAEIVEYNIEIITGWLEKSRYIELLTACNVFVAPRLNEGIGQSFLEAMSYGLAVVAPDSATMNEYVRHDSNGYLYNFQAPAPINFSNVDEVRARVIADVASGHDAWIAKEQEILAYIASKNKHRPTIMWRLRGLLKK